MAGWVWATSHIDVDGWWNDEALAYDGNPATHTYPNKPPATGWTGYIEFYRDAITCNAIKFKFSKSTGTLAPGLTLQVHRDGGWVTIWELAGLGSGTYTIGFAEGLVIGVRFRFKYYAGWPAHPFVVFLNQIQFYDTTPTTSTSTSTSTTSTSTSTTTTLAARTYFILA